MIKKDGLEIEINKSVSIIEDPIIINEKHSIKDGKLSIFIDEYNNIEAVFEMDKYINHIETIESEMYTLLECETKTISSGNIDKKFVYSLKCNAIKISDDYIL